jgi:hypothetical protein
MNLVRKLSYPFTSLRVAQRMDGIDWSYLPHPTSGFLLEKNNAKMEPSCIFAPMYRSLP